MPVRRPLQSYNSKIPQPQYAVIVPTRRELYTLGAVESDLIGVAENKTFYRYRSGLNIWEELEEAPPGYRVDWIDRKIFYDDGAGNEYAAPGSRTVRLSLRDLQDGKRPPQRREPEKPKEPEFKLPVLGNRKIDVGE